MCMHGLGCYVLQYINGERSDPLVGGNNARMLLLFSLCLLLIVYYLSLGFCCFVFSRGQVVCCVF